MKYIDLHCDALTKTEGAFHVTGENLQKGGCLLQCFAAFLRNGEGLSRLKHLQEGFLALCSKEGYAPFFGFPLGEGINAMFTVEGGGFSCQEDVDAFFRLGVRMASLTWNDANALGFPNFTGGRRRERERGLTPLGREVLLRMQEVGMAADVSHGSDALFFEVAAMSRAKGIPFAASHSAAAGEYAHPRNLTDEQVRTLSDCGGIVGLPFCAAFLSKDHSPKGQRTALLRHARRFVRVGGEDVLALGSDFDGIPENSYLPDASRLPLLLDELEDVFGARIAEKIASQNALRFFQAVFSSHKQ